MTADEIKQKLIWYYMTSGTYISAITEPALYGGFRADVLVVHKDFTSVEVEIKTSLADLRTELNCIKKWRGELPLQFPVAKGRKHSYYLGQKCEDANRDFVPNKFCFAVTEELVDIAEKEIAGTPYGLIWVRDKYDDPKMIVKAKPIHETPVDKKFLSGIMRRQSWENYYLRKLKQKP